MRKIFVLFVLALLFTIQQFPFYAQIPVSNLKQVKSIFIDESSFQFKFSSCIKNVGNLKIVCTKHLNNRKEFLAELKTLLEKYKFTLVADEADADAILQGELSIDDDYGTRVNRERDKNRAKNKGDDKDSPSIFAGVMPGEPLWTVNSWLVNQNGKKLWNNEAWFPEPSHWFSSHAKIQAKKLAKEIQHDVEKGK